MSFPSARASVIIVNYNGRQYLERCLDTLLPTLGPEDEVLLVDNGSTDGSPEWVERLFPSVPIVHSPTNGGFGYGCNLAARHARGAYLVFLNPDTAVTPGWLEGLISALEAPGIALATPCILLMDDPERVNTMGNDVHYTGLAFCRGIGAPRPLTGEIEDVPAISGAAFAVRREVWEALGGMDPSFFLYVEDTDLSWRAWLSGYRCVVVPQSVVYHRYTLRFGPDKIFYQERNRYRMLLKCFRWPTLLILFPALLLTEIVTWGFALMSTPRRGGEKWRAGVWTLRHWRETMALRREVQATRRAPDRALLTCCTHRLAYGQARPGPLALWAGRLLDPLFRLIQWAAYILIRW